MSEVGQKYSDLVGLIYESAMDRDAWPKLLEQLAESIHCQAAIFRVSDVMTDRVHMGVTYGHSDTYLKSYQDYFIHTDPFRPALKQLPAGVFYPGQAALSYEELTKLEFYNDMLVCAGLRYTLGGYALRDHSLAYQVVVQRGKELNDFSQEEIDQFNRLIPHFQRAFKINQYIAKIEDHRDIAEQSLDQLSTGILLLDEDGTVFHLNKKSDEIITAQEELFLVSGRLTLSGLHENSRLQKIISRAVGRTANKEMTEGGAMSLMSASGDIKPLSILVTPLNSKNQEQLNFSHKQAFAAVFIGSPSHTGHPDVDVIRMLYGLTDAEARLTAALAMGHSLNEICSFYRITIHTARSHLKTVFEKTECSRQAELVNLILTSPAAL